MRSLQPEKASTALFPPDVTAGPKHNTAQHHTEWHNTTYRSCALRVLPYTVLDRFEFIFKIMADNNNNINDDNDNDKRNSKDVTENVDGAERDTQSSEQQTPKDKQKAATKEWDEMADSWDGVAFSYRDSLCKQLFGLLGLDDKEGSVPVESMTVLDFGCGSGLLTEWLQPQVKRVISIDVSPLMVAKVKEKIEKHSWTNVEAYTAVLSEPDQYADNVRMVLEDLDGQVDLIVASSVFGFVLDLDTTMQKLKTLLKPKTGIVCHSDWPLDKEHTPTGFTEEKGLAMFAKAGLKVMTTQTIKVHMILAPDEEGDFPVYFGAAKKGE